MFTSVHPREKTTAAFHAAALGDALGWPNEAPRRKHVASSSHWVRIIGSRFQPIEEQVQIGEYSDDTQLILATARSIVEAGSDWLDYLAQRELPAWTLYERGGGRATKTAVACLAQGQLPWSLDRGGDLLHAYFAAGGNGAAMRILPHVIQHSGPRSNPGFFISDVCRNSILTHGHPRSILGAICHGLVLQWAISKTDTLGYGELVEQLIGELPQMDFNRVEHYFPRSFLDSANSHGENYKNVWDRTVQEMEEMLSGCLLEVRRGALASELDFLGGIGALQRKTNGSGTVCAVAALFLASRYATEPGPGLRMAAGTKGLDSDTVASMLASILGAINGAEWLAADVGCLQDSGYIQRLASKLWTSTRDYSPGDARSSREPNARKIDFDDSKLSAMRVGEKRSHPLLGDLEVLAVEILRGKGSALRAIKSVAFGGQTITIYLRERSGGVPVQKVAAEPECKVGVRFYTRDLERLRRFYERIFEMKPTGESSSFLRYGPNIVFADSRSSEAISLFDISSGSQAVVIEVTNLESIRKRLLIDGIRVESAHHPSSSERQLLVFRDPDGRRIETFSIKSRAS
jgi:ADP-ribosylglycohydrolase/catechol 2,3-dioxygenase-like lactoylglutathione lyase family enzyme